MKAPPAVMFEKPLSRRCFYLRLGATKPGGVTFGSLNGDDEKEEKAVRRFMPAAGIVLAVEKKSRRRRRASSSSRGALRLPSRVTAGLDVIVSKKNMTWIDAYSYAKNLGPGWRLPSTAEIHLHHEDLKRLCRGEAVWSNHRDAEESLCVYMDDLTTIPIISKETLRAVFVREVSPVKITS